MQLIKDGGNQTQILDASNRFYTLIPHNFGLRAMPPLDSLDVIKVSDKAFIRSDTKKFFYLSFERLRFL